MIGILNFEEYEGRFSKPQENIVYLIRGFYVCQKIKRVYEL